MFIWQRGLLLPLHRRLQQAARAHCQRFLFRHHGHEMAILHHSDVLALRWRQPLQHGLGIQRQQARAGRGCAQDAREQHLRQTQIVHEAALSEQLGRQVLARQGLPHQHMRTGCAWRHFAAGFAIQQVGKVRVGGKLPVAQRRKRLSKNIAKAGGRCDAALMHLQTRQGRGVVGQAPASGGCGQIQRAHFGAGPAQGSAGFLNGQRSRGHCLIRADTGACRLHLHLP